jgi:hypothetical protein
VSFVKLQISQIVLIAVDWMPGKHAGATLTAAETLATLIEHPVICRGDLEMTTDPVLNR